jgi:TRAP-type C4-dicarboxylate transport system substrate-binding protein
MEPIKLKWLIAHQPQYLFVRTAKAFRDELEKRCPGEFDIEILDMKTYIAKYNEIPELNNKPASMEGLEKDWESKDSDNTFTPVAVQEIDKKWKSLFTAIKDGRIDISQTQATVIGSFLFKPFETLDLPFLFKDHDHVTRALDGSIGENLRGMLETATGVKSLGFTYSGGFRIVGSNHDIASVLELKDTTMQTVPTTTAMFNSPDIKAKAFPRKALDVQEMKDFAKGVKSAIETTYLRFKGTHILKTNHSMFLTSILAGSKLFDKLTLEQQEAFKESAYAVSKIERKWSLEDCEKYERDAVANGVQIREITQEETDILANNAHRSYEQFYSTTFATREEAEDANFVHQGEQSVDVYNKRKNLVEQIQAA